LGLSTNDPAFANRFQLIYAECASAEPEPGSAVVLRCTVHIPPTGPTLRVHLDPPLTDAGVITSLLHDEAGEGRVAFTGDVFEVPLASSWQLIVGQLAVGAILALQPDYFFFHAGAVAIADRGVLLTGRSGSGKTSVSLALAARGHGFLSDEVGALRLDSGELVPVRRAALVRHGGQTQQYVSVSQVYPAAAARIVRLTDVVYLRSFASVTSLETVPLTPARLDLLTPLASSLCGSNAGTRVTRVFAHLGRARGYALDAASPEEAATVIERALAS